MGNYGSLKNIRRWMNTYPMGDALTRSIPQPIVIKLSIGDCRLRET